MTYKRLFIIIFAVLGLLTVSYYLGYFLVSKNFLPEIAKSAGSLIKFDNNVEIAGKLGIGTNTPGGKLEIKDGTTRVYFEKVLGNYGADKGPWGGCPTDPNIEDTCNGKKNNLYSCPAESNINCRDIYYVPGCGNPYQGQINIDCKIEYRLIQRYVDEITD